MVLGFTVFDFPHCFCSIYAVGALIYAVDALIYAVGALIYAVGALIYVVCTLIYGVLHCTGRLVQTDIHMGAAMLPPYQTRPDMFRSMVYYILAYDAHID